MEEDSAQIMKRFHVSEKYGFVLEDPMDTLPEYFEPWEKLAKNCANLMTTKKLRDEVNKLELLDVTKLGSYREHRLAHMYMSYLTNGYVWQEGREDVPKVLPKQLAVPLCSLADYFGIKPIFTYAGFGLSNWKLIDETRPAEIGNIRVLCQFPGGEEFEWFTLVSIATEIACAPALKAMLNLIRAVKEKNDDEVVVNLNIMTRSLVSMRKAVSEYHEKTTAHGFFFIFGPLFAGWGGPDSPLPDGLIYEGVSDVPLKLNGANASQTSTISCFDAVLGVQHEKGIQEYLNEILNYMPRDHREFILFLRKSSTLNDYVMHAEEKVRKAYDDCAGALRDFRSYHINIVAKYVIQQAKSLTGDSEESVKSLSGMPLMPMLKSARDSTTSSTSSK